MDIPAYGERNLARNQEENDKKICCGALPSREERKSFEKFLKKWFEQVKYEFFKNLILEIQLIETTVSIDRNRQRLHKNFKCNFDCSKKQIESIETQRLTKF